MVTGNIKEKSVNELMEAINKWPWFGAARKELCERMSRMGAWSEAQYSEASLYVPSRSVIASIVCASRTQDYSDRDVETLLKSCLEGVGQEPEPAKDEKYRRIVVVGGDYFTQAQYEGVRKESDSIFPSFARESGRVYEEIPEEKADFCTETLAAIYVEQGYIAEAKEIYSKLSLRYPEKSVYFATLIQKLDNK